MSGRDPRNPKEWQAAVDTAHVLLLLDSARQYGLITGGPEVAIARCEEILKRGADKGFTPSARAVDWVLVEELSRIERGVDASARNVRALQSLATFRSAAKRAGFRA